MREISFFTRMLILAVYVIASCYNVKGWSCLSTEKQYSRLNGDVNLVFIVTVTSTPTEYTVYFYNILLGSIVIYNGGVLPNPKPGISISGDVTGHLNVTLPNVQISSAGMYRIDSLTVGNQCVFLYIIQKPSLPTIKTDKEEPVVGENVTLTCSSKSNTIPSNHSLTLKYSWKNNNTEINDSRYTSSMSGESLRINSVQKQDSNNKFICLATEDVTSGYNSDPSDNLTFTVLYGPDICYINTSSPYVIAEGNTASTLSCESDCYPLCSCSWKNSSVGNGTEKGGNLNLGKVTRYHTGNYLCTCISDVIRDASCSKSLFISVDYISFSIGGHEGQKDVVVDEFDIGVNLTCKLHTYHEPFVQIKFQDNVVKEQSNSNVVSFTPSSVTCFHTGVFTCTAGGYQSGTTISESINLFVRCSPRPLRQMSQNYTSSLFSPVTLTFIALAYPEPGPIGFTWHKQVGTRWIPIRSNTDLQIYSTELQTTLKILNMSQSDYGQYRVTVINDVGSFDQYIFVTEKDTEIEKSISGEVIQEKDSTGFVIGICLLGGLCLVVTVYAIYVTVLIKKIRSTKGTEFQESSTSTQAINLANLGYLDRKAQSSSAPVLDEYENSVQLYTQLDRNLREDKTTYDIIQKN